MKVTAPTNNWWYQQNIVGLGEIHRNTKHWLELPWIFVCNTLHISSFQQLLETKIETTNLPMLVTEYFWLIRSLNLLNDLLSCIVEPTYMYILELFTGNPSVLIWTSSFGSKLLGHQFDRFNEWCLIARINLGSDKIIESIVMNSW